MYSDLEIRHLSNVLTACQRLVIIIYPPFPLPLYPHTHIKYMPSGSGIHLLRLSILGADTLSPRDHQCETLTLINPVVTSLGLSLKLCVFSWALRSLLYPQHTEIHSLIGSDHWQNIPRKTRQKKHPALRCPPAYNVKSFRKQRERFPL